MTENEESALAELIWELTAPHTQEEIAVHLGVTQQTVSRIEASALEKMRSFAADGWDGGGGLRDEGRALYRTSGAVIPSDGMTRSGRHDK